MKQSIVYYYNQNINFPNEIFSKVLNVWGRGIPLTISLLLVKFILFLNILQQFTCDRCLCTKSPLDNQPVVTGLQLTKWNKRTCETFLENSKKKRFVLNASAPGLLTGTFLPRIGPEECGWWKRTKRSPKWIIFYSSCTKCKSENNLGRWIHEIFSGTTETWRQGKQWAFCCLSHRPIPWPCCGGSHRQF